MMLGAFAVLTFSQILGLNFWLSAALGILSLGVFGYLLDAVVMRRVIGESQASVFILTVAIALILKSLAGMTWGWSPLALQTPFQQNIEVGRVVLGTDRLAVILGTVLLCTALYLFFGRTRAGLAIQRPRRISWPPTMFGSRSRSWFRWCGPSPPWSPPSPG